jgi:cobalt-precorrin-5B (C1)-methyltransferase
MGDARMEVIAAYAGALGADTELIKAIIHSNTTEETIKLLAQTELLQPSFNMIAEKVRSRSLERVKNKAKINVIIVSMDGTILGTNKDARSMKKWVSSN